MRQMYVLFSSVCGREGGRGGTQVRGEGEGTISGRRLRIS